MKDDLSRFSLKFQAVVDWAEIEVRTASPRTYHDLRHALPHDISFAEDVNQSGTVWRFKIHDVERWEQVDRVVLALDEKIGLLLLLPEFPDLWRLVDLEVAVDVRIAGQETMPPDELKTSLAEIAESLLHNWVVPKDNWRFSGNRGTKGQCVAATHRRSNRKALEAGRVLVIGNQHDDAMPRMYVKSDTEKNGQRSLIKQSKWSARLERSNLLAGKPPMTLAAAKAFRFESLSDLWRFYSAKDDLPALTGLVLETLPNIGHKRNTRTKKTKSFRVHSPNTQAAPMNERFRQALRNLTGRTGRTETKDAGSGFSVKTSPAARMDAGFRLRTTYTTEHTEPGTGSEATDAAHDAREQRDLIPHAHDTDRAGSLTLTSTDQDNQIEDGTSKVNDSLRLSSTDHDTDEEDRPHGRLSASPPA